MKTRYLISFFHFWNFAATNLKASNTPRETSIMCYVRVVLFAVLFLTAPVLAQDDTLILLGCYEDVHTIYAVSAYDKNAFVADYDLGIRVINYSNPYNPYLVTRYPELARDIEIKDSLAYYVGVGTLYVRDISNPLESEIVGSGVFWEHLGLRVHLFDTLALVMHSSSWQEVFLKIIDISDPTTPTLLSTIRSDPPYGTMWYGDAYKKDNYVFWVDLAYVDKTVEERGKILVYDITDPTQPVPVLIDTCLQVRPYAIWIEGEYAYVAEGNGGRGLVVFDISDPYHIDSVGCFPIPEGRPENIYIKGKYAYICTRLRPALPWDRVYVLDITDPTNLFLVTYYNTPGYPQDVFVDEPYVLVADYTSLLVFEASFLNHTPGDVNKDEQVDIGDVVFLINYLYRGGQSPDPIELGDVNGDCVVDVGDVVYLINYLFKNGPAPQSGCAF